MPEYYISSNNLPDFISALLPGATVVAPTAEKDKNVLMEVTPENVYQVNLAGCRAVEAFKSYLFRLTEKVSRYFGEDEPTHGKKLVFLGARDCDVFAINVLDKVLREGDFVDPCYAANRENLIIIGTDCTACGKTCFCTMVHGKPYPQKGFDLNLSPLKAGYVVEIGSEKGRQLAEEHKKLFEAATAEHLAEKGAQRKAMESKLAENNHKFTCRCTIDWTEAHKINLENQKAWKQMTKNCVECSACNFTCPTCTCFLLLDEGDRPKTTDQRPQTTEFRRHKIWDACLKTGYARVAGGANSRPKLFERLQNRYHCKFDYSFDRLGFCTCVGCGRCIDGCAGNIDMREVYAELVRQVPLSAKLE
jgi:ferredoxin